MCVAESPRTSSADRRVGPAGGGRGDLPARGARAVPARAAAARPARAARARRLTPVRAPARRYAEGNQLIYTIRLPYPIIKY